MFILNPLMSVVIKILCCVYYITWVIYTHECLLLSLDYISAAGTISLLHLLHIINVNCSVHTYIQAQINHSHCHIRIYTLYELGTRPLIYRLLIKGAYS